MSRVTACVPAQGSDTTKRPAECAHSGNIDWLLITETWIKSNHEDKIWAECSDLNTHGLKFFNFPRLDRTGGGIGLMVKEAIKVEVLDHGEKDTFEYCVVKLNINRKALVVVGIYHPPAATGNTNQQFINEFLEFAAAIITPHKNSLFLAILTFI